MVRSLRTLGAIAALAGCSIATACQKGSAGPQARTNTAPTAATHDRFPIASGPHAVECNTCHGDGASFRDFNCTACHAHNQGTTDQLHKGVATYSYTATSCFGCHADGSRRAFDHAGIAAGCASCHAAGAPFAALPFTPAGGGTFTHPDMSGNDCAACHSRTSWQAGAAPAGPVSDPARNLLVNVLVPTYAATSIASFTPQAQTLAMPMNHASTALPAAVMSGCANCHVLTGTGSYYPGKLHASLADLGLPQPDTCLDCHSTSMPVGFVGPTATSPARVPPSGEMKHGAVEWADGAPTTALAAPVECGLCHVAPQASAGHWSTPKSAGTTAVFHAALSAAGQPQPSSCIDCHANTRPSGLLTAALAALPSGVRFDHGASVALGDCVSCHTSSSSWTGGKFHLQGSGTPSSCDSCHEGERPTSTANWKSTTYSSAPFDYGGNAFGNTHGDGLDCVACHTGPGTGSWGGTQNWVGGSFAHAVSSIAGTTCIACHATQRPDLVLGQATAASLLPGNFDHAVKGAGDCFSCHQATVAANAYAKYFNPSGTLPGGDWAGGVGAPDGIRDPSQDIVVVAEVPAYAGTSIVAVAARTETLPMPMYHSNASVPQSMSCDACHAGAASANFFPGRLHASLATQPQTCLGCHAASVPVGFVGPIDARRSPASGEMKHDAVLWSNGARTPTPAVPQECALCHLAPPTAIGWATALKFHTSVPAQPSSCLDCHANSRPALLTSANAALPPGVQFNHSTATGECTTCHVSFVSWAGGKFHLAGSATPASCVSCHEGERPTSTANWKSTTYSSAPFDYATHGAGLDCVACHAGPGIGSWGGTQNWVGGSFAHAAGSLASSTCVACHSSQRPDLNGVPPSHLPDSFDHSANATTDCFACHQATVTRGSYALFLPIPGGDWRGGVGPPAGLTFDVAQNVAVAAQVPTYVGMSITAVTAQTENLPMPMLHSSAAVPASMACGACHAGAATGTFFPGRLHASLATQPAACLDCHATSAPAGFVGPIDTRRTPASGAMKHDAVLWSNGARTTSPAVPQECSLCHRSTSSWTTALKFHASVGAQPPSCLDCHANSRPALLTSANAALPAGVQFDHATAIGECTTCHVGGSSTSWTGGKFHLAGSATPTSCLACHQGERPTSTAGWLSATYQTAPFDYATHGAGLDCVACHAGPGTGSWGGTQNWVGGSFAHAAGSLASSTCVACHSSQRPDLNGVPPSQLPGSFDHSTNATTDCFACHQATVTRGSYARYEPIPGGDWRGGIGPPAGLTFDVAQNVAVAAEIPTYVGTSITAVTAQTEKLPMPMFHSSAAVPQSMACGACHAGAATGTFFPGRLHASLTTQPTACLDCHATSAPAGFVGPIDTRRRPASGEMKHDAVLWSNGAPTGTRAAPQECSLCHRSTSGWATALKFHASVPAQPSSCLDCHANSRPALLTSANAALPAGVQFDHSTATGECTTCHVSLTSWTGGRFHLAGSATPTSCLACHQGERPTSTANWKSTTYSSAPFDYATHGAGLDCVACHAGPGTGSWGGTQNWVGGSFAHAAGSLASSTCVACHSSQRPDLNGVPPSQLPGSFNHAVNGTSDCFACHQATVTRGSYARYEPIPGGDWTGGVGIPDNVRDPSQDIVVTAEVPAYAGTSIVAVAALTETLPMPMYHTDASVPQSMSCDACHAGAASGNFFPGRLHASLATQPQTCLGCHAASVPVGFVGPIDARRSPASGEMKHDAVLWSNGAPTGTRAVPQECALCHLAPPTAIGWATALKFHTSVGAQLSSCLDCHANSRPALLTSANAALPAGVRFDHSTATGECTTCHVSGSFTSWTGGKFHLAGSATPTSCLACHQGERPTSTTGWISATYQTSPFDYAAHGAGLDCASCHAGPGTGSWGGTQNWVGGSFAHGAGTPAASTCVACHSTQRPDLVLGQATAAGLLPGNFDHAVKGTADCFSCHQATVAAKAYVRYFNASGTLPGGDWAAGVGTPDNVRDLSQDVAVAAQVPTYVDTSITVVTAKTERLPMPMFHSSATVPQSMACGACHAGAATGTFFPGRLHASLANQPTACLDCHATSAPAGFVGPIDARRAPVSGEMKHDAVLWSNGARTTSPAVPQECSLCHRSTSSWTTALKFHASVGAQPPSCLDCHANSRPALLTSANAALPAGVQFDHSTATGECTTCHVSFTSWTGGRFHLAGSASPASCLACHQGERPTSTAGWLSSTYQTAPFDYATHGAGLDCVTCHAGPGTGAWGGTQNWVDGRFAHGAGSRASSTCIACHSSQRPDLNGVPPSQLPGSFDHAANATTDCVVCHQATVSRGGYASYRPIPGGDWRGGVGPPAGLTSDVAQNVIVTAGIPSYSGASIVSVTPRSETLAMQMLHGSSQVPAPLGASCVNCHADAASGVYYPGVFHASLTALGAAQPLACLDCHAGAAPTGFVGPVATNPARNPPSAEMKHDAVAWSGGKPGTTALVTQDCAQCHLPPLQAATGAWGVGRSGAAPAPYHASLAAAPSSCIDCHANSRPSAVLTSTGAALPPGVQFDHTAGVALADCVSCHASSSSWTGGKFHLQGSSTPSSCISCHEGERPTSTANWKSTTYSSAPFDYGGNTLGNTHGDGLDCVTCHAGPGNGEWGGTQNWVGGSFAHGAGTPSARTCVACHSSQRPDLNGVPPSQLPGSFDHSSSGTGDCIGCHQATVGRASYVAWLPIPGGDWRGGVAYPADKLIGAADQNIQVTEIQLDRGTGGLVVGTSVSTATLYDQMLHTTTDGTPPRGMPSQVYPGPAASPDATSCWHCHTNSNGMVTSYLEGRFHSSLSNYSETPGGAVTPLPQPSTSCVDCHGQMRPAGIVERSSSDLQAMDHSAAFTSGTTVAQMDCAACHQRPGKTWTDGMFHALNGSDTPRDCVVCHYPLMADAAQADVTSGTTFAMSHGSTQLTIQACNTCHPTALSMARTTPLAASLWQGGALHANVPTQPTLCLDCHWVSLPESATQSVVSYRFAAGGTSSNALQWMNHITLEVVGQDCAVCHLADARASGGAWSKTTSFHAAVPGVASCFMCHGLGNGVGSIAPGTNNNMPSGLTDSSTLTTASNDPTTGVPAGTHDQISHADVNVTGRDCNACHTQVGPSSTPGIEGAEWAQASFHANFIGTSPLIMNGTTGRCSNCHMNVKPGASFTAEDHSDFTDAPGSQDCSSCHTWPGTGSAEAPNWLGAAAAPAIVTLTGWSSGTSITSNTVAFSHPGPSSYTSCAQCHTGTNFSAIIDYNHDGLTSNVTINGATPAATPNLGTSAYNASTNPTFCVHCHNTGSPWVSKTGLSSTIIADTTSGSKTVTTASTAALTQGMTISGAGIPNTTTTTTTFTANTAAGSTTVTTASPVSLSAGTVISGPGIPPNDTVATSVSRATSFTLTTAATADGTGVTLTATRTIPLTVTITSIASSTAFVISSAANDTLTGTTLTVTHRRITQAAIGKHQNSTDGQDCTSCHYVGGNQHLTPPTPGVFATGSIGGG